MTDKKERAQSCRLLTWEAPRCFIMNIEFTEGKPRVRNFEGGNNPNNPCQPGSPNFDPTLNRCFRRGPS
ncbi:MAG: hypothetical protein ACRBEE_02110 [Arenicella sp.]